MGLAITCIVTSSDPAVPQKRIFPFMGEEMMDAPSEVAHSEMFFLVLTPFLDALYSPIFIMTRK